MIADEGNETVTILGCNQGIDWTILHTEENKVKHIAESGHIGTIDLDDYRKLVCSFADQVEQFYKDSKPKMIEENDRDRAGYFRMWKEWGRLRYS